MAGDDEDAEAALTALLSKLAEETAAPPPEVTASTALDAALERIFITRERLEKGRFRGGWVVELESLLAAAEEVAGVMIEVRRGMSFEGFPALTGAMNARLDRPTTEGGGYMDDQKSAKPKRQVDITGRIDPETARANFPGFTIGADKQLAARDEILARRRDRTPEEKAEVAAMLAEAMRKLPSPGGGMR